MEVYMVELLSPVGDFDCLKAAVQNGANAVYFGGQLFNARYSAKNFDKDGIREVKEDYLQRINEY